MSTADQILGALFVAAMVCILSLCWSLQQAHHRLDDLELEVFDDENQDAEVDA
jgi:fumarate reductase subunit D